jgi:hypothetical protein
MKRFRLLACTLAILAAAGCKEQDAEERQRPVYSINNDYRFTTVGEEDYYGFRIIKITNMKTKAERTFLYVSYNGAILKLPEDF